MFSTNFRPKHLNKHLAHVQGDLERCKSKAASKTGKCSILAIHSTSLLSCKTATGAVFCLPFAPLDVVKREALQIIRDSLEVFEGIHRFWKLSTPSRITDFLGLQGLEEQNIL